MRVLVAGAAGTMARRVVELLLEAGDEVIGIDRRPWPGAPSGLELHRVDVLKRAAEDVFRRRRPEAVIHMATVSALAVGDVERHRINLGGTKALFEHCGTYGVQQVVFVGRHTYYGAAADAPLYHREDEPPQALEAYPELSDLVASDLFAATALWRLPKLSTAVLRLCYTLGPSRQGTLASFLRGRRVPMVLGFDPLFQFMHEEDAARAVVLALRKNLRGIYNVAGPPPLPLSLTVEQSGRLGVPLPEVVLRRLVGHFGFPKLAPGAIDHLKYPIVVDDAAFRKATEFSHRYAELEVLEAFGPPPERH